MASKNLTFDPDAGVPYAANLTIYGGSTFSATYNVTNTSNAAFDFSGSNAVGIATTTGWTGSAQMSKSVAVGATLGVTTTFTVGFTSAAGGVFNISLGSTDTNNLTQGRYVYNVLVSSGATIYNIVNGNILVYSGISSAP
tara:strand:+ start:6128 stop:6547 length:420 start_codon:yes stop_codon:yes gene_type:complete